MEYIELQCLEGYSPIGGVKSAVCHHEDSFGEMSLPVLECEGKFYLSPWPKNHNKKNIAKQPFDVIHLKELPVHTQVRKMRFIFEGNTIIVLLEFNIKQV